MKENFFNIFNSESNVTDIWNFIKKEVESIIETNVPSKTSSTRQHQPWINTKTKRLLRKKQRWYQKAKDSSDPKVWKNTKILKIMPRGPVDRPTTSI